MTACIYGHLPIVRYLTEMHHVDLNHEGKDLLSQSLGARAYLCLDNEGMTPILLASLMGHVEIVSYFHHQQVSSSLHLLSSSLLVDC
jgi:ankyrin repeat protein